MSCWLMCLVGFLSAFHPVHVSVTNIEYNESRQLFEISFKVFSDDFRLMMTHLYGSDPLAENDNSTVDNYFRNAFRMTVNETKQLELGYAGTRQNEEATWYSYRTNVCTDVKTIGIRNQVLLELYGDQTNLVIFRYGSFDAGYRFNIKKREITFSVDEN